MRPYTPVHPDPVLEPWRWRSFPELNGLGLRCLAEATDKAMWFGVDDGVRRYDGVKWMAYTEKDGLYGAPVVALCGMRDGSVYAGTEWGISRFREGKWSRVFPPEGDLPWPINNLMEARDGSLWAGTEWGALRLGQDGVMLYTTEQMGAALRILAPGVRLSIVPDAAAPAYLWSRPHPWSTGEGIGVITVGGGGVPMIICALAPGGPGVAAGLKVGDRIIAVDGQPDVGLDRLSGPAGTSVKLTVRREGQAKPFEVTVTRAKVAGIFRNFPVYDVFEDREGAIWFGLGPGEIVRYTPSTQGSGLRTQDSGWRLYTKKDGLDIDWWPRIVQTRDGVIWTVSFGPGGGVNRFDGKNWTRFHLSDLGGDNNNTSILETRDGTLWVSGNGPLHALRDGTWRVYRSPEVSIPSYRARLLEASDGTLWVAGWGQEAARLDYGTARWTTYTGLNFQCETPDGAQWFLSQDSSVVRYDPSTSSGQGGRGWTRYGVEDGLMDIPVALLATRKGELWAAGSHDSTAATARLDGNRWSLQTHPRLSWGISERAVYESSEGSLWFGPAFNPIREQGHLGGVLRFDGNTWSHYTPSEVPIFASYGMGQTADGILYFGGLRLVRFDGQAWTRVSEPDKLSVPFSDVVYTALKGDLWVGTRTYGVFHYDGKMWTRYDVRDGLADNRITSILETNDSSVWVGTPKGISRFDGQAWTTYALPSDLRITTSGRRLRQSRDGAIWINSVSQEGTSQRWRTIRYQPDAVPPETEITVSVNTVSQPGNTVLAWEGADPWKGTPDEEVQYSYRMDKGEWSPFSTEKNKVFLALNSGSHSFEVRARDRDFNVDPTPVAIRFTVVPPVWRQPWFIGLVLAFVGIVSFQASRIVIRDRKLREANAALSLANKDLFEVNRALSAANEQIQEATRRKSAFLASMSHELRTPMNAIMGFTQLVLRRAGDLLPERQRDNLVKVRLSADHLLNLINDILDLSKIEAGRLDVKPARFEVKKLIASCCETVSPLVKTGVELKYEVSEDIGEAYTDEARLRQIVINLLSNALKFTEKGEVKVRVQSPQSTVQSPPLDTGPAAPTRGYGEHGTRDLGPATAGDRWLIVAVSDTGIGIPAEALGYIFDEFRQVEGSVQQQKGTGLGLSITKKLTELLGGTIGVESEVGKGSTFTVRIPKVYAAEKGIEN